MIACFSIKWYFQWYGILLFSVDQSWYNGIKWIIITIGKDVYQFSQSTARQKRITIESYNGND